MRFMRRDPAPWLVSVVLTTAMIDPLAGSVDVEPITPIAPAMTDPVKADLGGRLFRDVRLSKTNSGLCVLPSA
jgi:hypothetical protein